MRFSALVVLLFSLIFGFAGVKEILVFHILSDPMNIPITEGKIIETKCDDTGRRDFLFFRLSGNGWVDESFRLYALTNSSCNELNRLFPVGDSVSIKQEAIGKQIWLLRVGERNILDGDSSKENSLIASYAFIFLASIFLMFFFLGQRNEKLLKRSRLNEH